MSSLHLEPEEKKHEPVSLNDDTNASALTSSSPDIDTHDLSEVSAQRIALACLPTWAHPNTLKGKRSLYKTADRNS